MTLANALSPAAIPISGGLLVPDEDPAITARCASWRPAFGPLDGEQEWLFKQMVVGSVRVERSQSRQARLKAYLALRATVCWEDDRRSEVEDRASRLRRSPSRTVAALRASRHGCDWLLA